VRGAGAPHAATTDARMAKVGFLMTNG
jgi:hypothetical protein